MSFASLESGSSSPETRPPRELRNFDNDGTSLHALHIASEIHDVFGDEVKLRDTLHHTTPCSLSSSLEDEPVPGASWRGRALTTVGAEHVGHYHLAVISRDLAVHYNASYFPDAAVERLLEAVERCVLSELHGARASAGIAHR